MEEKPCKVCVSVEDMMNKARAMKEQASKSQDDKTENNPMKNTRTHACPVDKDELGRSTWNLLHTMSVYYPEKPSKDQKDNASIFMKTLSETYPCEHCAQDLKKDLKEDPPKLNSREDFSQWMCRLHNKVNTKLGKPEFDCRDVLQRWRDGWKDGSCDY